LFGKKRFAALSLNVINNKRVDIWFQTAFSINELGEILGFSLMAANVSDYFSDYAKAVR
jgi:hypothetical protein